MGHPKRSIFLRIFKAQPQQPQSGPLSPLSHAVRWVAKLPPLHDHISVRKMGGSGILIVWTVDEFAEKAGLGPCDRLLGYDKNDGKGIQVGSSDQLQKLVLRCADSPPAMLDILVERPAAGATSRQSVLGCSVLASRRSSSQTDFLLRQQRARNIKAKLTNDYE